MVEVNPLVIAPMVVEDNITPSVNLPNIREESLYNQCLFKTITLQTLKLEFSSVESYHILTIKIRALLLKESNTDPVAIQALEDEITFFYSSLKVKSLYHCCLAGCPYKTSNHKMYVSHLRALHSNSRQKMTCQLVLWNRMGRE